MILAHHLLRKGVEISNYNCVFACFLVLVLVFAPRILSSVIRCVNIKRRQSTKELMLLNCGAGEDSESPLDCKEIQPVHPKGDQSGCCLEGLMLKLKLQYFGHLMQRVDSLEKNPDAVRD